MAEFKISRIRYNWRGNWVTGTTYNRDDVIKFGAKSWVCIRQHTAGVFEDDYTYLAPGNTLPSPAWEKMTDGFVWRRDWTPSTLYNVGDIISYGGSLYSCKTSYTSGAFFDTGIANWDVYANQAAWNRAWAAATRYGIGDVVKYNGIVYICTAGHTSQTITVGLEGDIDKWSIVYQNIEYRGDWATATRYRLNDLVRYGATIWRCNTGHTASTTFTAAYFNLEFLGSQLVGTWNTGTYYSRGDIVSRGGDLFIANTNSVSQNPSDSIYQPVGTPAWAFLCTATKFRNEWVTTTNYRPGEVVRRGGQLYKALVDTTDDLSSLDYLDTSNWELIVPGDSFKNTWTATVADDEGVFSYYAVGDIVTFEGSAWRCNVHHFASDQNYPSLDNGSGNLYWDLLIQAGPNTGLREKGDLLAYGRSRTITGDGSTLNETAVLIGEPGKILTIDDEDNLFYAGWGNVQRNFYVSSSTGVDDIVDPDRGINFFKPWKTIRYACEQVEAAGYTTGGTTINVWTGTYDEILPIIIPAKTGIVGSETRTVTVRPNQPIAALASDSTYTIEVLQRISALLFSLFRGTAITATIGNTQVQNTDTTSSDAVAVITQTLIQNIIDYITFYINGTGSEPVLSGTNTVTTDGERLAATEILTNNLEFLAAEGVALMQYSHSTYEFDSALCARDTRRFVEALAYDLSYPGNYKSLMAARYYKNAVLGSETEDMFYVRDATGIRNMTLAGLTGTLSPPLVNELYRRATGGAYVSLDPGWGPADSRTWIVTRSCYVQNVATFGYAAIGQKIDGSLHNGGNKSIVSNDFTQVISDGIGAWVLNGGRAELVSVFTYYSHIGYFAEQGGVIRATNGNNSYGTFGALADGNDPTETPSSGTVNNRTSQATVVSAFAGESTNQILIFEYGNAGQNYTTATYNVIGSGTGASVIQEEIRDNAVFEVHSTVTVGGGYTQIGNNAQTGGLTTITLSSNDTNEEANLLGLRIILTSGGGTGQYGYVQAFNSTTKVLTVYKESTGTPGWDHVIPGWPLATLLTTSTTYRIEPRPIFSAPEYNATAITFPVTSSWADIIYGEVDVGLRYVTGSSGTGTVVTDDGLVATPAVWAITTSGRNYSVSLYEAGAGYADEDIITVLGTSLGGVSPDNDITIRVKSISNDSTNSILTFTYEGVAASGTFVITDAAGNKNLYSKNGTDWVEGNGLPVVGNWKAAATGEKRFVALCNATATAASSVDGITWTPRALPALRNWNAVIYGNGIFLAVAGDQNAGAFSINGGTTWASTTLPTAGDSTINEWVDVTYGKNQFVAVANSNNLVAIGTYSTISGTWTWASSIMDTIADSSQQDWVGIAYGNNRYVAISSQGSVSYSFDGYDWYSATMPSQDGSTIMNWKSIKYAQGVFFAICDTGARDIGGDPTTGPSDYAATSPDGIVWTSRTLPIPASWTAVGFGNPDITTDGVTNKINNSPVWILVSSDGVNSGVKVSTGATVQGRAVIESGILASVKIWDPGSGYTSAPTLTLTDPNKTSSAVVTNRLGDGVLTQPSWINRGVGYRTSTTDVTINGDGYADAIPTFRFVTLSNMLKLPKPGAQLRFTGNSEVYKVVVILDDPSPVNDLYTATFQISPYLTLADDLQHGTTVSIRERYSQIRITGHDFLDIGTGNAEDTNYPALYSTANFFSAPENEIVESNGGKVFYTSTDQSGNFRTGELFSVEQASGTVTISADFFDLKGLTELALGGVRLGGSATVIREFSTDALFTADSNNIIPTQRAIKAYLSNRLNIGGADLLTASFIAGTVRVGSTEINSSTGSTVLFPTVVNFDGSSNIYGSILAQNVFYQSFGNDINRV
jgi:hypothetical protein